MTATKPAPALSFEGFFSGLLFAALMEAAPSYRMDWATFKPYQVEALRTAAWKGWGSERLEAFAHRAMEAMDALANPATQAQGLESLKAMAKELAENAFAVYTRANIAA